MKSAKALSRYGYGVGISKEKSKIIVKSRANTREDITMYCGRLEKCAELQVLGRNPAQRWY
ncbi:hypothetical protein DPMN_013635 [Dreissena polymorpha]|uniref:Uncharacterized protein n=1 Tax=Dreissena polymorpha TaxID=45954 RepID=A0A9D4S2P2_DREPO|nr:hypothetical protein DPMN_013635 [Dreissena polymorpha]